MIQFQLWTLKLLTSIWLNNNYEEQLNDIKSNLNTTHSDLLSLEIEDTDELYTNHMGLERLLFECSLQVRRLSADAEPVARVARDTRSGAGEHEGVKLPRFLCLTVTS